jgi:hypothetical protein
MKCALTSVLSQRERRWEGSLAFLLYKKNAG